MNETVRDLIRTCENLIGVVESHDIALYDCDRAGVLYCDCLSTTIYEAKSVIAKAEGKDT